MSDQEDPLQQPLEGWMTLADVVSDTAPGLADLMVVLANLARVAAEDQIGSWLDLVTARFELTGEMYTAIRNEIGANAFPLRADVLIAELAAIYEQLPGEVVELIGRSPNGLSNAVMAQSLKSERLGNSDETAELYRELVDRVTELYTPADIVLEASCSIEHPDLLGDVPIECARLARRHLHDRLSVAEFAYGDSLRKSFTGKVHRPGPVGRGPVGGPTLKTDPDHKDGYDPDINALRTRYFHRRWTQPGVMSWVYTMHVTEGPQFQRAANAAAKMLEQHRTEISNEVRARVKSSTDQIKTLVAPTLTALGVTAVAVTSVMHPLVPLAAAAASAVIKIVVDRIIKALKGSNLTTWSIGHTVVTDSDWVPLSIFTLSHDGPPNLCGLTAGDDAEPQLFSDYSDSDVFGRARFMLGTTEEATGQFDHAYFDLVANANDPLAWHDPWKTRGGFRVLLPHSRTGSDAMYVSAVCADVRYGPPGAAAMGN